MKTRKDGSIGGKGSRRAWHPKSSGTSGEIAMFQLLTKAGIKFRSGMMEGGGVRIQTKFREWPFSCDFLLSDQPIIIEVQGGLHFKTWKGRPAKNRMKKDEIKRTCLEASGYTVLAFTDTLIKQNPKGVLLTIQDKIVELTTVSFCSTL